jgi:hypothetical protein
LESIEFKIPNEWNSYLKGILADIDVEKYDWIIGEMTEILGKGNHSIFDNPRMSGTDFYESMNLSRYYIVHALFLALPKGIASEPVRDFDDFSRSNCEMALIIIDCTDVNLYAKDPVVIQQFMINAVKNEFTEIRKVSDEIEMKKYFQPFF